MGGILNTVNLALYTYASQNPLRYIDPDGRAACGSGPYAPADCPETYTFADWKNDVKNSWGGSLTDGFKDLAEKAMYAMPVEAGVAGSTEFLTAKIGSLFNLGRAAKVAATASKTVPAFGNLLHAAQYGGIRAYKPLAAALKGTGLHAHHLIPQRFAKLFGQDVNEMLSVAVSPAEHNVFTQAWRTAISYGEGTRAATREQVLNAAKQIYKDYPAITKALGL